MTALTAKAGGAWLDLRASPRRWRRRAARASGGGGPPSGRRPRRSERESRPSGRRCEPAPRTTGSRSAGTRRRGRTGPSRRRPSSPPSATPSRASSPPPSASTTSSTSTPSGRSPSSRRSAPARRPSPRRRRTRSSYEPAPLTFSQKLIPGAKGRLERAQAEARTRLEADTAAWRAAEAGRGRRLEAAKAGYLAEVARIKEAAATQNAEKGRGRGQQAGCREGLFRDGPSTPPHGRTASRTGSSSHTTPTVGSSRSMTESGISGARSRTAATRRRSPMRCRTPTSWT